MKIATIAIIGAGNMGASLAGGLINDHYPPEKIWLASPIKDELAELAERLKVNVTTDNTEAIQTADVVIFAVKGQVLPDIAATLREKIQQRQPLVMSVLAGFRIANIEKLLGDNVAIVRVMPNTPALIRCGASALYANALTSSSQRSLAESLMRSVGISVWLDTEKQLDAVTALSGCGPAYYFYLSEVLQQAGEALGLSKEVARLLTQQTALGAAKMAFDNPESVVQLRQRVMSPGGATERAMQVLENNQVRNIFLQALQAAEQRSEALAEMIGKT